MSKSLQNATTKLPLERLAQLDRLAARRNSTRSRLVREAIEMMLDSSEEPLSSEDRAAIESRRASRTDVLSLKEIRDRRARRRRGEM
jgi:predicted DNA-binding protein